MIYSFKISPKWYNFVFSRQNYTENRWRCIGRIWLGILKKYFAWKLCITKVCYGPNISSVWKSSMWTILHGFLADSLLSWQNYYLFSGEFLYSLSFIIELTRCVLRLLDWKYYVILIRTQYTNILEMSFNRA